MQNLVYNKKERSRLSDALSYFISTVLGLLVIFLLIRTYEIVFTWSHVAGQGTRIILLLSSFFYDILFFLEAVAFIGALYVVLFFIHKSTAKVILNILSVLVVLIYLLLVLYFSKSAIPLGSDLFGYSLSEIQETVTAAGGMNPFYFLFFAIFVAAIVVALLFFRKIKLNQKFVSISVFLMIVSVLFGSGFEPQPKDFTNTSVYFAVVNKLQFFSSKTYTYLFEKDTELPVSNYYIEKSDGDNISFNYTDDKYPFLHEEKTPDVLANYFNVSDKKPNFVFIITESLGRGYSGENAYLGSFTPFLDSLEKKSLYWENFLSTGGRTFAALPSIFGSLPFGEKGFLEMGDKMPRHFSLIKYLKHYGYAANFYYGGDAHFDLMDVFLHKQNIDLILDQKNFGNSYKKMPTASSGFSWGYGDKDLFKRSFDIINSCKTENQMNIYLTLSMHSPFIVDNMDYYRTKFDAVYSKLNLDPQTMDAVKNYRDILSCVLYTDDAFKEFFDAYKKRDDFNNTIFIITGDHRMPEIPITTQIDRFHVPLIIYSPLLKRTAKFSSVSSHFDITPTLLAFLSDRYQTKKITASTFIGSTLDTARQFRNIHSYPLMRNKNELLDYLYQDYFYSDKTLYKISPDLDISPIDDNVVENKIANMFDDFKRRNNFMIQTGTLVPDSLLNWR
ncbi:MAG: LTA synthase family protein [Bacteroidetes bacterium]|nr:LTA synthase family protein [Bacteroidota bacterium]